MCIVRTLASIDITLDANEKWPLLLALGLRARINMIVFPLFAWHMPTEEIRPLLQDKRAKMNEREKNCWIYNVIDWNTPAHVRAVIWNESEEIRD